MAYDESDYDDSPLPTTTAAPLTCSGNITMFTKTYCRGESVMISNNTQDLADFNNKLVSLKVAGSCCWTVYSDTGYTGEKETFRVGEYRSAVSVGKLFRQASSVRRTTSC